jgi:hypothetical protein
MINYSIVAIIDVIKSLFYRAVDGFHFDWFSVQWIEFIIKERDFN